MKILVIGDVKNWAIGHLARIYIDGNPQFHFRELYIHPKEVGDEAVKSVVDNADWADIIVFEYWRTAQQIIDALPDLKKKKLVLMHHNQKNLTDFDQSCFSMLLCHTKKAKMILNVAGYKNVEIIPYGLDFDYWKYNEKYPPAENTVGYAGRTVPWKNIHMVAQASFELKYPMLFMGKMDKMNYWNAIPQEHRDWIDMSYLDCPDEERRDFYNHLAVFVNASSDGREEGTMPLLEAMACGVPVITTRSGTAADIIVDRENGIIIPFDDPAALKDAIERLMLDLPLREKLRKEAWNTIRGMSQERMARRYADLFYRLYSDQPLVSVVIPTTKKENVEQILRRLDIMEWQNLEAVVCDDSGNDEIKELVNNIRRDLEVPIRYTCTDVAGMKRIGYSFGYGLAEARNRGIVESQGEYILFCDSRMLPEKDCIGKFMDIIMISKKSWLFGDKGANKDTFVENFSFIRREEIIYAGMFNERIDQYGGMSQEIRERFRAQGFKFGYVPEAKATQLSGSHMNEGRRRSIIAMKDLLWKLGL